MDRKQATELAREYAKRKPEAYYSEPFEPHEWVVDAVLAAHAAGLGEVPPIPTTEEPTAPSA